MRVLWISCLLMGSVSCVPVQKDRGSQRAASDPVWQPSSAGYGFTGAWSSDPKGGFPGLGDQSNSGPGPYGGHEAAQAVPEWSNYYRTPAEETWVSESAAAVDEPVLSDVSDLEPLFSISSRSRYQRGRAVFSQSRYTPIYSVFPAEPEFRQDTKTPAWSGSKASGKYGY